MTEVLWLLLCLALAVLLRIFAAELVRVKGSSMRDTLQTGQFLWVNKWAYRTGVPRRGDVVICHYPGRYMDRWKLVRQCFVKRVIGLPGESISLVEGVVHINGEPLEEPYLSESHTRFKQNRDAVVMGPDEYFLMGDNRDRSNDSRRVGPIRRRDIIGRAERVLWPVRARRSLR